MKKSIEIRRVHRTGFGFIMPTLDKVSSERDAALQPPASRAAGGSPWPRVGRGLPLARESSQPPRPWERRTGSAAREPVSARYTRMLCHVPAATNLTNGDVSRIITARSTSDMMTARAQVRAVFCCEKAMSESARFRAAFPAIMTAIKICGDGTGMRIQLDVPESEMPEALKLLAWRERVLVVEVRPEDGQPGNPRKSHF